MTITTVSVFAPATVANLGPGYDVIGLALEAPGDTVHASRISGTTVRVSRVTGDHDRLPPAGVENTAAVAARLTLERLGNPFGLELELHKGLPLGSGLGSSGASAAAGAFAANLLAGSPLAPEELVAACAQAEASACGSAHADNVTPALLGGVTLVRSATDVTRIHTALDLYVAVISPRQELSTRLSREAIPAEIPVAEAIHNVAHLASLVYALAVGDLDLLRRSLVDHIAEPRRAGLIPGFPEAKRAAMEAGALGASISGAGPAVFALCDTLEAARAAGGAMVAAFDGEAALNVSPLAEQGAREVDR
jgi:homoserine kinase